MAVLACPKPVRVVSAAKVQRAVYQHVSERDELRCRACGTYEGEDIHRHHLRGRGFTTVEDVCCVCDDYHEKLHVRIGGKRLRISGNAEQRNAAGVLNGLTIERRQPNGTWMVEGFV